MSATRSVLIVAYTFPPRGGVGGLRPARLARALARSGWQVSVVAADSTEYPPADTAEENSFEERGVEVIRIRSGGLLHELRGGLRPPRDAARSAVSRDPLGRSGGRSRGWLALRSLLLFPDDHAGFIGPATQAGLSVVRERPGTIVVSTSPPESCHRVGARLSRLAGVPWIADFRDPWSFSHLRAPSWLDRAHSLAEAATLAHARAIVTVSDGWGRRFQALYPTIPCHVIRNGHSRTLPSVPSKPSPLFRVVYTGKLDLAQQDPTAFLEGLRSWQSSLPAGSSEVVFHLYGAGSSATEDRLEQSGVALRCGGPLDHAASLAAQDSASVLVLFGWKRDPSCVPAKLYDYLASRRRILVMAPREAEVSMLVERAGVGESAETAAAVERTLAKWYGEWLQGMVEGTAATQAATRYSFETRGTEYVTLLDDIRSSLTGSN